MAQGAGSRDKSGALDPWAYALLHKADTSGQLDPWAYAVLHKPDTSSQLDPWAYAVLHRPAAEGQLLALSNPRRGSAPNGFDWADAAIGAGSTLALVMLSAGAIFTARRTRGRMASVGS